MQNRHIGFGIEGQESLDFDFVQKLADWRVLPVSILSPGTNYREKCCAGGHLALTACAGAAGCFVYVALRGFPKMLVSDLKRLYTDLATSGSGPVPNGEVALMSSILRQLVPEVSDLQAEQALPNRGKRLAFPQPECVRGF